MFNIIGNVQHTGMDLKMTQSMFWSIYLQGGGRKFSKNIDHKSAKTLKNRQHYAMKFDR